MQVNPLFTIRAILLHRLSKPADNEFKPDITLVPGVLFKACTETHTEIHDRYTQMDLSPENNMFHLLEPLDPKLRLAADLTMRRYTWALPPQVTLHYQRVASMRKFLPVRPFGLPTLHYTRCSPGEDLVTGHPFHSKEYAVGVSKLLEIDPVIHLYNDRLELFNKYDMAEIEIDKEFRKNTKYIAGSGSNGFKTGHEEEDSKVVFMEHSFYVKDGTLCYAASEESLGKAVDVFINNEPNHSQIIQQIAFHLDDRIVEVMILFENLFMAAGYIRKKRDAEPGSSLFVCDVNEITGSLGTTHFVCSENFKSMVRVTNPPNHRPSDPYNSKREKNMQSLIKAVLGDVEKRIKAKAKHAIVNHVRNNTRLNNVCESLRATVVVFQMLVNNKSLPIDVTAREAVHRAHIIAMNANKDKCKSGLCQAFDLFLDVCAKYVESIGTIRMKLEYREEFGFLLMCSIYALFAYLSSHAPHPDADRILECLLNPAAIYTMSAKEFNKRYYNFPKTMRPVFLDIMAQNVTPKHYSYLLSLYGSEKDEVDFEKDGKMGSKKAIVEMVRKYPHILLASEHPPRVKVGLINDVANYLPAFYIDKETFNLDTEDVHDDDDGDIEVELVGQPMDEPETTGRDEPSNSFEAIDEPARGHESPGPADRSLDLQDGPELDEPGTSTSGLQAVDAPAGDAFKTPDRPANLYVEQRKPTEKRLLYGSGGSGGALGRLFKQLDDLSDEDRPAEGTEIKFESLPCLYSVEQRVANKRKSQDSPAGNLRPKKQKLMNNKNRKLFE